MVFAKPLTSTRLKSSPTFIPRAILLQMHLRLSSSNVPIKGSSSMPSMWMTACISQIILPCSVTSVRILKNASRSKQGLPMCIWEISLLLIDLATRFLCLRRCTLTVCFCSLECRTALGCLLPLLIDFQHPTWALLCQVLSMRTTVPSSVLSSTSPCGLDLTLLLLCLSSLVLFRLRVPLIFRRPSIFSGT